MEIFSVHRDCPLASAPEGDNTSANAFAKAKEATVGYVDAIDKINADAHRSPVGKAAAIAKLAEERGAALDTVETLLKKEVKDVAELDSNQRQKSDIDTPVDAVSLTMISGAYLKADKSGQLKIVREADALTARALLQIPAVVMGDTLSDSSREVLTERLLAGVGDGTKYKELAARRVDLGRATYAVTTARAWINKKAGIQSDLRSRLQRGQ